MSDHERGAYTPPTTDAPLSFDPRQPVRGARSIPFTLILSVLVLAALVAAIFVFYRSGVRQAAQAPEVVGTPVDGIKSAATPEAQPQDPAAGLQIYKSEGAAMETVPRDPTFVNPPEQPRARPTTPVVVAPATPAATAKALKPAIVAAAPVKIPPAPAIKALPVPVQKVAPPVVKPPPVKAAPAPKPEAKAAVPVTKKPVLPESKAASTGGAAVQIGAVSSTSLADKAWSEAVASAPGLGVGKGKSVEKIEKNGGTLYRTAVTGFASKADAQAFCVKLQAAGKNCFVR